MIRKNMYKTTPQKRSSCLNNPQVLYVQNDKTTRGKVNVYFMIKN